MDQPCPNCGNRQHSPGVSTCRVCGKPLIDSLAYSGGELSKRGIPSLQAGNRQNLPLALRPCLTDQVGRQYLIHPDRETFVGSLPGIDISIPGFNLQPRHARLFPQDQQIYLEAMIGCLVLINGRAVGRTIRLLHDRDLITFSQNQVVLYQANSSVQLAPNNQRTEIRENDVVTEEPIVPEVSRSRSHPNSDLYGRVRHVDGPYMEDPDPNLGRALSKAAGFALALWKPAFILLQKQNQQVPVRYLRIETVDSEVRMVKMKGNLVTGAIHTGDYVAIWGEWQNGTLLMHRGFNETTQSAVYLRQ